ncbi:MAG: hypothetical protein ACR2J3_02200 [Aridibacter sp.]
MQRNRYTLLFVIGLILTLGLTNVFANGGSNDKNKKVKRPKNTGILSIKATPNALPVKIDGQVVGMSGINEGAEFYLTPGIHLVEIEGPNGQRFSKEINVIKNVKNCICLNVVENTINRPCPYNIVVDGPDRVNDGDLITFSARDLAATTAISPVAVNYTWKVTPDSARITSGLGTSAITVDTTGLGEQSVTAEVTAWDGVYDANCRQIKSVNTDVAKLELPPPPTSFLFDEFPSLAFDDDKARLDNLVIELQNNQDNLGYVIIYQGTDKRGQKTNMDKLQTRTLDYLVKTRGVDPRRITIVRGGTRPVTTYQIYIIPPNAATPTPNQ